MKPNKSRFKINVIYGMIVAFPFAIIFITLEKLVAFLRGVSKYIGLESTFAASLAIVIALLFLLIVFYALGALMHTKIGALSFERLEKKIFIQIPGYKIISNMLKGFTEDKIKAYRPALVQLYQPGTSVFCFVMEENDNNTMTVFVPSVPTLTVGSLHVVEPDRVVFLKVKHRDIVDCITGWGVGSNKIITLADIKEN
jgi:uncharacterized membrane protein